MWKLVEQLKDIKPNHTYAVLKDGELVCEGVLLPELSSPLERLVYNPYTDDSVYLPDLQFRVEFNNGDEVITFNFDEVNPQYKVYKWVNHAPVFNINDVEI